MNQSPEDRDADTLGLLLGEPVRVSVVFGRARLPLQKVVKLATGSILELEGSLKQAVEVIVNDRIIASGEVVVVDGNYGVRIHAVASRQERFDTASGSR
jgi:flagellar motor switch protein FliN/FliY